MKEVISDREQLNMTITRIEAQQLRNMEYHEGLVIQGCGGELQEWADGINEMLTEEDILKNGSRFEKCYAFKNENLTCMLFPFEDVQLEMGKLAMWRGFKVGYMYYIFLLKQG